MRVVNESSLAMSNQTWRTFLSIDLNALGKGETKAAHRHQESLGILVPKSNMYSHVKMQSGLIVRATAVGRTRSGTRY